MAPDPTSGPAAPRGFRPGPFAFHEEVELEIETLTNMGQGLGRRDGWVTLVPFALPGERVRARVYRNQKNYSEADLVEVLRPSPERVEPGCPLFGTCGGCQYQNLAYEAQLRWKTRQVEELLWHMARVEAPVRPAIPSPRPYGYRSKLTPHFAKPKSGQAPRIGFLRAGSRSALVEVDRCPIAMDGINAALPGLKAKVRERARRRPFRKGATLLLRQHADGVATDPKEIVRERVGPLSFRFPAGEFFQNNPFILERFAGYVGAQAAGGGARFLVDAYCGSGLFALTAARRFERVLGVEISEPSLAWARENARSNGVENVDFRVGDAADLFAQAPFPGEETAAVIDPPRRGADEAFLRQLLAFAPRTAVYVSCNPATQVRDLNVLLPGGYAVAEVQPFDLFPQTKRLECVVTLRRRDGSP